ncbi:MAG: hypothetical protein AB3N13_08755 [Arenibacterium sp.]
MTSTDQILKVISAEAARRGVEPTTICGDHADNKRLPGNLAAGKTCTIKTANKILAAAEHPPLQVLTWEEMRALGREEGVK